MTWAQSAHIHDKIYHTIVIARNVTNSVTKYMAFYYCISIHTTFNMIIDKHVPLSIVGSNDRTREEKSKSTMTTAVCLCMRALRQMHGVSRTPLLLKIAVLHVYCVYSNACWSHRPSIGSNTKTHTFNASVSVFRCKMKHHSLVSLSCVRKQNLPVK